jgi:lactoylglutathione lyase
MQSSSIPHPGRVSGSFHTGITVSSLDRSLPFYCDLLGLTLLWRRLYEEPYVFRLAGVPDATSIDTALLEEPNSGHKLELLAYGGAERSQWHGRGCDPGTGHLGLVVDDIGAVVDRLRDGGVVLLADAPVTIDAGANQGALGIYLRDPDGFLIELHERPREVPELPDR